MVSKHLQIALLDLDQYIKRMEFLETSAENFSEFYKDSSDLDADSLEIEKITYLRSETIISKLWIGNYRDRINIEINLVGSLSILLFEN